LVPGLPLRESSPGPPEAAPSPARVGRRVSQWGFTWGQFLDHSFGLRAQDGDKQDIPFDQADLLEEFTNDLGMVAEPHVAGSEFGELQLAVWKRQFQALRDGDRFFLNDPGLSAIRQPFGIDFRHTLAEIIAANTDIPLSELNANVFVAADEE
jgi:hypothetical protein